MTNYHSPRAPPCPNSKCVLQSPDCSPPSLVNRRENHSPFCAQRNGGVPNRLVSPRSPCRKAWEVLQPHHVELPFAIQHAIHLRQGNVDESLGLVVDCRGGISGQFELHGELGQVGVLVHEVAVVIALSFLVDDAGAPHCGNMYLASRGHRACSAHCSA